MKIAVLAANGGVGQLVVSESLKRGMDVTAVVRGENKSQAQKFIQKDLFDLTKEDLAEFDVVVNAFGVFEDELLHLHSDLAKHLTNILAGTSTRLLIVGGAGSLYVDEAKTTQLVYTEDFPKEFYPLAKAMTDELDLLRKVEDVNWLFISPAADFELDYPVTGEYIKAGEVYTENESGESAISYADYALALVDEIENNLHNKERIHFIRK
ncbi:MAG: NAD(P)H-binding protein [Gemella sp.]|nr:NAD(P)H-binding protein [Gemella sp.]